MHVHGDVAVIALRNVKTRLVVLVECDDCANAADCGKGGLPLVAVTLRTFKFCDKPMGAGKRSEMGRVCLEGTGTGIVGCIPENKLHVSTNYNNLLSRSPQLGS